MSINCCKSYVGKQIIGLLPGGAEECWYLVYLDSNYYGYANWTGWTLNGNDLITELTAICQAQGGNLAIRDGITNASVLWAFYLGTSNTTYAAYDPANNETPIAFNEVAKCEACYQFEVPYGQNIKGINVANIIEFSSITAVDDQAGLQIEFELLFGSQISVSSVWNGSNYIVTINNAWDPGAGISLVNSSGGEYIGSPGDCPITPPEPVPLALLDAYGGAGAAYSVRKLSSSYTGAALRVRRSSDNTEQDIGFVGLDLDTTALSSFVGANNGFVTTWYDQSGNAINLEQTTAAEQPQIVSSGTIITQNGLPSISFDRANSTFLACAVGQESNFDFTSSFGFFFVVKPKTQTGDQVILDKGQFNFGSSGYYFAVSTSSNYISTVINSPSGNVYFLNTSSTNLQVLSFNLGSGTFIRALNNTNTATSNGVPNATTNNTALHIGRYGSSTEDWDGWMSEIIIYPTNQSANRTGIETNMDNYYSLY